MNIEQEIIATFEELGLTEYEAQCFLALSQISQGTAKEISQISDVLRSRVYDTVDRLHKRGLVDVQQSEPREYRAIPPTDAFDRLREDFESSIDTAESAIEQLDFNKTEEDKGTWAIAHHDHVNDRLRTLISEANEEIHVLIADTGILHDDILDQLSAATDRDVTVIVEVATEEVQDRIQQALPTAQIFKSVGLQDTTEIIDKRPGLLVMVDNSAILASGVEDSNLPGVSTETALWSHGKDHGIAAWIHELLVERLQTAN